MNEPQIAIIINSFNRLALLIECLKSLTWIDSEFAGQCVAIVYDAGSTDGSVEWLRSEGVKIGFKVEVIVPNNGDDTSFAAGLNAAAWYAEKRYSSLKYLLFYETDNQILNAEPLQQALKVLEENATLAACGFTVRKHDGTGAGVGQPFPTLLNFALGKNIVHRFNLEAIPYKWERVSGGSLFSFIDVVYTSPLVVKLNAWKDSGGLDSAVFPFSDCDVDWAKRLRNIGWRMGVIKTDFVIHDNREAHSSWSKSRAMQNHRGRLRYFQRHQPIGVIAVWPILLMTRHLFELISTKIVVKNDVNRTQLSNQFLSLLKSCPKSYE